MKKHSIFLFMLMAPLLFVGASCNQTSTFPEKQPRQKEFVPGKGEYIGEEGDDPGIEYALNIKDPDESFLHDAVVSYNEGVELELDQRRRRQIQTLNEFDVFKDFSFSYARENTGIDFRHRIVDDAGISFNFNHYDHGNGVAVADVDGDGLYDIYFVTQIGENQLWKNNGDGTFTDITEVAGVGLMRKVSISASFADIDNDGDADLFVTTVKHGNVLFENGGNGVFRNITKYAGVNYRGHSSAAVFFDYDLDGLLDLLVVNVGGYTKEELGNNGYFVGNPAAFQHRVIDAYTEDSILYKNMGDNVFEDVTEKMGIVNNSWSGDAAITDFNADGYPDVYLLSMEGPDHYYENISGERFEDKTAQYFPRTSSGAMGVKFFDYDNDLDMDLYVTDMHSDMGFEASVDSIDKEYLKSDEVTDWIINDEGDVIYGNTFYRNDGDGSFTEVSDELNLENYWPWGVSVADFNADGYQDIFTTVSMNYLYKYVPNILYLNNKGQKFLQSEYLLAIEPRPGNQYEKKWFDLDCINQQKDHLECKDRSGQITTDRGPEVTVMGSLGSRSSVVFDFDNDGDLDIITNEFNDEPLVLLSNLSEQKEINYLSIQLKGSQTNRDGLGAFVTVYSGENIYRQYHDGASGYLSHSRIGLYFGLGEADSVEKIEVLWPNRNKSILEDISEINRQIIIEEE